MVIGDEWGGRKKEQSKIHKDLYANRDYMKGAFFDVLQKPMFVIEQENEKGLSTYFCKVYKYENGNIGIFGIGIDSKGKVNFKTYYHDEVGNRMEEMLTSKKINIKYIKEV